MASAPDLRPATRRRLSPDLRKLMSEVRHQRPRDLETPDALDRRRRNLMAQGRTPSQAHEELERIIDNNDLVEVSYLERGLRAARAVGRVHIRGPQSGFGTGFLVSPRLMLTNNHVLPDTGTAAASLIEFDYEHDGKGADKPTHFFDLRPQDLFLTDAALDFTLVAVAPAGEDDAPLGDFGWLPLLATPGKALRAEYLTIIQHPGGQRKQIGLRENKVLRYQDNTLWYATDTQPGSSGSPVFNDSWEVVALHHKFVPAGNGDGDGAAVANEGIRVSRIVERVRQAQPSHPLTAPILKPEEAEPAAGDAPAVPAPRPRPTRLPASSTASEPRPASGGQAFTLSVPLRITVSLDQAGGLAATAAGVAKDDDQERISIDPDYTTRRGFDAEFLGTGPQRVSLPQLSPAQEEEAALLLDPPDGSRYVLDYHHFSVVVNRRRRLAFFTAVNIDGARHVSVRRESDAWFFDPRIERAAQAGEEVYRANPLDRGHLVRRLDPAWGTSPSAAKAANDDTFHFTNCSPQHQNFNQNQTTWAGLEDYILNHARNRDLKVSVFSGPVFAEDDEPYRGVLLPREFWKVVAMVKDDGHLSVTAYLLSQAGLLRDMLEAGFSYGNYNNFQVPLRRIEEKTGLSLGNLPDFDPLTSLESDAAVEITDLKRIRL